MPETQTANDNYIDITNIIINPEDRDDSIDVLATFDRPLVAEDTYLATISYAPDKDNQPYAPDKLWVPKTDKDGKPYAYTRLQIKLVSSRNSGEKFSGRIIKDGFMSTMARDGSTDVARLCNALGSPLPATHTGQMGQIAHLHTLLSTGDPQCLVRVQWEAQFTIKLQDEESGSETYYRFDGREGRAKGTINGANSKLWPKDEDGVPLTRFNRTLLYVDQDLLKEHAKWKALSDADKATTPEPDITTERPGLVEFVEAEARVQETISRYSRP